MTSSENDKRALTLNEIDERIKRLLDAPDAHIAPGDRVCVDGAFFARVYRVGERGAMVVTDAVWDSLQRGFPPDLREMYAVPLNRLGVTGASRRFREHISWHVGTAVR